MLIASGLYSTGLQGKNEAESDVIVASGGKNITVLENAKLENNVLFPFICYEPSLITSLMTEMGRYHIERTTVLIADAMQTAQ